MDKAVGVLGGGQLGRMLLESANRLNVQVNILDEGNSSAKQIAAHNGHIDGSFKDPDCIKALARKCDVLTVEIEHVNTEILEQLSSTVKVEPNWRTIRTIQNKYLQKQHLVEHAIPVAEFEELELNGNSEVQRVGAKLGFPLMLKSKMQAYDGRGNSPVKSLDDISSALSTLGNRPLYAEKWASFTSELAVMVVKCSGGTFSFPTVETVHEDSICKLVYAPPRSVTPLIDNAAQDLARRAVASFRGRGVFGVEMFLLPNSTLLVNEIAPRPHNSGHYTIEACPLSQYDAHLRAILDLPIPEQSLKLRSPAVMLNILGGATPATHLELARRALSIPGASIHLYAKGDARPGRKMGHVTITAASLSSAETAVAPLISLADTIRAQRTDIPGPSPSSTALTLPTPIPLVGVIMGSDSDLPHLIPGLKLLTTFRIPFETRVTSAHRTPSHMAAYGASASSRGLKVIIAAAGGAAHLPGMCAAYTSLPVVGVPIKTTSGPGDGMDALLSIVMMPRGVPVATVGTGNAVNAALLAARILGSWDVEVRARVEAYAKEAEAKAMNSDETLVAKGWEAYSS